MSPIDPTNSQHLSAPLCDEGIFRGSLVSDLRRQSSTVCPNCASDIDLSFQHFTTQIHTHVIIVNVQATVAQATYHTCQMAV